MIVDQNLVLFIVLVVVTTRSSQNILSNSLRVFCYFPMDVNIQFILAFDLLDPFNGENWKPAANGLNYAKDMVKLIREYFDDFFTICVAGI